MRIKLQGFKSKNIYHVETSNILTIQRMESGKTTMIMKGGTEFNVKETPDEIADLEVDAIIARETKIRKEMTDSFAKEVLNQVQAENQEHAKTIKEMLDTSQDKIVSRFKETIMQDNDVQKHLKTTSAKAQK